MPTMPAILGPARLGNFRLGYMPTALAATRATRVRIFVAGVEARVRVSGLSIHDALNDRPNEASLTLDGSETPVAQQSLRISINSDTPRLLFDGALQEVTTSYQGQPTQLVYPCSASDDLARLNRRRPFGTWLNISATTVAQELVTTFAPDFSASGIQASLPLVSINLDGTEGFSGALAQLANAIGGYFYVEDAVLHLFQTETSDAPDDLDSTPGRFLDEPPIRASVDTSQLRTRVFGKGHGEPVLADVAVGDTIIPVANAAAWFGTVTPGGQAITDTQVLTYTGGQAGGTGSLVGPSAAPVVAPMPTRIVGAGVEVGVHDYAYVWVTAAGKTLPSPLGRVTTRAAVTAPGSAPGYSVSASDGTINLGLPGDTVAFTYSYSTAPGSTDLTQESAVSASTGAQTLVVQFGNYPYSQTPLLLATYSTDPDVRWIHLWVSRNGGTFQRSSWVEPNLPAGGTVSINGGYTVSSDVVPSSGAQEQVVLAGIALGPTGTTSREIYRTVAGGAQLKLQQTIANNTDTVGVTDATADASLGANAPSSDTSGLSLAVGHINAGSTSILTPSAGPFSSGGGWAINGEQMIRYTGISGNTLTGIPAVGIGSILNTINYGEHLDAAPALTGVTGLILALVKGAPLHIWVQRDDLTAQTAQAIIDAANGRVPADGVWEGPLISDERRNEASLIALCDVDLQMFSAPIVTVSYATRDVKTKSGKSIVVNLASPPITQTLTIQDVTIDQIDVAANTNPRFTVVASSVRFSLADLLRRALAA
jgi:hypothetical protein